MRRAEPGGIAARTAVTGLSLALLLFTSCRAPFDPTDYNPDWTAASHGASTPNYAVVFPDEAVNRIDIFMTAADWTSIRTNMTALWGFDFGAGTHPCCGPYPAAEPNYIDVRVQFNGKVWKHVGFRLKGNSSLHDAWNRGIYKLPFRLRFDQFEDAYGETWNQRLYGFREMSMAPSAFDQSLIRERLANDLFRATGVPAARTASYRVYIDFGRGLEYNGVYTMIELPEDTMLQDQLGERSGNLYKPESHLTTFVASEFRRQNNQGSLDYSDVQALITAVNNTSLQASNPAQWRANLEATFNVDQYLKFLAVNNAIGGWDAYGLLPHNFYLYNHSSKKLTWIPWDQNLSLGQTPGLGLSLTMKEVDSSWPLIRYLMDDPVYYERYRSDLRTFYDNAFMQERVDRLIDKYHVMLTPFVIGPDGEQPGHTWVDRDEDFSEARSSLKGYVASRRAVMKEFLR